MKIIKNAKERNREIYIYNRGGRPLLSLFSFSLISSRLLVTEVTSVSREQHGELSPAISPLLSYSFFLPLFRISLTLSPIPSSFSSSLSPAFFLLPFISSLSRACALACVRERRRRFLSFSLSLSLPRALTYRFRASLNHKDDGQIKFIKSNSQR